MTFLGCLDRTIETDRIEGGWNRSRTRIGEVSKQILVGECQDLELGEQGMEREDGFVFSFTFIRHKGSSDARLFAFHELSSHVAKSSAKDSLASKRKLREVSYPISFDTSVPQLRRGTSGWSDSNASVFSGRSKRGKKTSDLGAVLEGYPSFRNPCACTIRS